MLVDILTQKRNGEWRVAFTVECDDVATKVSVDDDIGVCIYVECVDENGKCVYRAPMRFADRWIIQYEVRRA